MTFYVYIRNPGIQISPKGGAPIRMGMALKERRATEPEEGWEQYLWNRFGPCEVLVLTHGHRGQLTRVVAGNLSIVMDVDA